MRAKPSRRRQTAQPKEDKLRTYLIVGAVAIGVGALVFLLYLSLREPGIVEGLQRFAGLSRSHDEAVVYDNDGLPPVGGTHSGVWQNCGIYSEPIDSKNAVHSMEHGAVWLTYQPELPGEEVDKLQDLVRGERFVLMSPFPGLRSPVILTAWGIQLELDSAGDGRISEFITRYQQGPQTPELGASCVNGLGTPIS